MRLFPYDFQRLGVDEACFLYIWRPTSVELSSHTKNRYVLVLLEFGASSAKSHTFVEKVILAQTKSTETLPRIICGEESQETILQHNGHAL